MTIKLNMHTNVFQRYRTRNTESEQAALWRSTTAKGEAADLSFFFSFFFFFLTGCAVIRCSDLARLRVRGQS